MRNPFYSVLALIVHLFSLAVLFLLLSSAFVAAAQVVVYAGAVMVLYVFVVAYVGGGDESAWEPIPGQRFLAPLLGIAALHRALDRRPRLLATGAGHRRPRRQAPASATRPRSATCCSRTFLLAFEASSILLLLAAVGAVVLAPGARRTAPRREAPRR